MSLLELLSSPSQCGIIELSESVENRVSLKPVLSGMEVDVGHGLGGIATFLYGTYADSVYYAKRLFSFF